MKQNIKLSKQMARQIDKRGGLTTNACFHNAVQVLIQLPGAVYAEGFAVIGLTESPTARLHAWAERDDEIIDPSLSAGEAKSYHAGLRLAHSEAIARWSMDQLPVVFYPQNNTDLLGYEQAWRKANEAASRKISPSTDWREGIRLEWQLHQALVKSRQ